ncbi:MAG: serine/threonine protein kinase, partial [Myxococcales bacterium]
MEATVEVIEQSQVAETRRVVAELAKAGGMPEKDVARASLIATELASNLVKYGKRGACAISWFEEGGATGIQIIAADHGPGIANFKVSSRDGHSTGGSLGIGLGAIMRAADQFDHYSLEGAGAVFFTRISVGRKVPEPVPARLVVGSRALPKPGETICGDGWASKKVGRWQRVCVVDGLGHGPLAALASAEATKVFAAAPEGDYPDEIIMKAHPALKSTRGAVMAVAAIDVAAGTLSFSGVGNIAAVILGGAKPQHLSSVEGVVGFNARGARRTDYPWTPESTLVMNSDGLSS